MPATGTRRCAATLLLSCVLATSAGASYPDFCVSDAKGYVVALSNPCPAGTSALRTTGVNLFDIFWGAWGTGGPNATMQTSLAAIRDAAASGFRVARTFASPWGYTGWGWFDPSTRDAYWAAASALVAEAEARDVKLIPSLWHGCPDTSLPCNPAQVLFNETYREFITNATSRTRLAIKAYHQDFVSQFKYSPAILMWELGNEMNLFFDGCTYDKSPGAFISTAEGLAWQRDAIAYIKAVDPERPVNSGMSIPRSRAKHLMNTPGGAAACVSAANPQGDCAAACTAVPADSEADFADMLALYSENQDVLTAHFYGCAPPYGNLSWCDDPASTAPLQALVSAATALQKPLYVGEFGPYNGNWSGADSAGRALLVGMAGAGVALSTLWAFECPSHDHTDQPGFCLHPGMVAAQPYTFEVGDIAQSVQRQLAGLPPRAFNMSLHMLPPPATDGDAACLDGSAYGYYALPGKVADKWVVLLQGGGWCFGLEDCFARTQPAYAGGGLGSSKYWQSWYWAYNFGPAFADWGALYLPYCDGGGFAGDVRGPVPYNASVSLHFRGAANMRSALADFQARFGVAAPAEVVVSGGSAGGLSTILHVDAIGAALGARSVVGVPQCGWFPFWDAPCAGPTMTTSAMCNATGDFRALVAQQNASGALAAGCRAAQPPGGEWRCFMAAVAAPFVAAPLFVWQSKFDHFQLEAFLSVDCAYAQAYNPPWAAAPACSPNNTRDIRAYGAYFMQQLQPLVAAPGPHRALYLTSCVLHGMDYNFLTVGANDAGELGVTPNVAFNLWYRAIMDPASATLTNDYKWVEDLDTPRVDNPLACPPFVFAA